MQNLRPCSSPTESAFYPDVQVLQQKPQQKSGGTPQRGGYSCSLRRCGELQSQWAGSGLAHGLESHLQDAALLAHIPAERAQCSWLATEPLSPYIHLKVPLLELLP